MRNAVCHCSYPARPNDTVYNGINLSIQPGESVALVGPSGGGKSTMTKLILRFYDPTEGAVLLNGQDIRSLNLHWYRQQIGLVGQEPVLFSGTIRDNIRHGKPGASDEEVAAAARAANCEAFILQFPQRYDTAVGQAGTQLSGGQKQRIAIARAIIKDPAILLLDEATSALDSESEKVVQEALRCLRKVRKRTTITIAHRLSTIQDSDRIAVMANAAVAELGTHEQLLALGGIYAGLCAGQGGTDEAPLPKADVMLESVGIAEDDDEPDLIKPRTKSRISGFLARKRSQAESIMSRAIEGSAGEPMVEAANAEPQLDWRRLWRVMSENWAYVTLGFTGAIIAGGLWPGTGVVIANTIANMYGSSASHIRAVGKRWALGFVGLGFVALAGHTALGYGFGVTGQRLIKTMREMYFGSFIRQGISWFDREENNTATLTMRLEKQAARVNDAVGTILSNQVQLSAALLCGLVLSVIASWQIGLVALVVWIPLLASARMLANAAMRHAVAGSPANETASGTILGGALNGITTIMAFNMQGVVAARYKQAMVATAVARQKQGLPQGLAFGYSQALFFWVMALLMYWGAVLTNRGTITFLQFFQALFAIFGGASGIDAMNLDLNAQKNGKQAAADIFAMADSPLIADPLSESGARPTSLSGKIHFSRIRFSYPTRPNVQIYGGNDEQFPNGFDLSIAAGERLALVGPSGGGKSTCCMMLLRFYEPDAGAIYVDGRDIRELNVHWLRAQIGYVGQEPVLFMGTIFENIASSKPTATQTEVEAAAIAANAHDFITAFKGGYSTEVGEKSALLSGGQKQRIAIARAILKDPGMLILDEATSALDNESERVVQKALDNLQTVRRRTTLIVAHRLSTIRDVDKIAVIAKGGVAELGTHEQLLAKKGIYSDLWRHQTTKTLAKSS